MVASLIKLKIENQTSENLSLTLASWRVHLSSERAEGLRKCEMDGRRASWIKASIKVLEREMELERRQQQGEGEKKNVEQLRECGRNALGC